MKLFPGAGRDDADLRHRLHKDIHDAYAELLSAQCATQRLKRTHRVETIATADPEKLTCLLATARSLCEFYGALGRSLRKHSSTE